MTDKQKMFVIEYLKDFNATQAAIRSGYSENVAHSIGHENTKKPEIKAAIDEEKKRLAANADSIIYANIKYWQSVREDPEARPSDRLKASELLGKYGAMFTEKIEHNGEVKVVTLPPYASKL